MDTIILLWKCKSGGIHITYCSNCNIQDTTWDGCGNEITGNYTEPGIKFNCSSNVTIQKCCLQNSIGQALVLSEMSRDININHCSFVNNSHYRGHGAVVHYLSNNARRFSQFVFTIKNCNFTNNKCIKSLVHIENKAVRYHKIIFNSSTFCHNQGASVYVINHKIYAKGKFLFQNNVAEDGAGIYISGHSTVIFGKTSNVRFNQNSANNRGGAIFLTNNSACFFHHNSIAVFHYNKATKGGAIYSEGSSNTIFNASCKVTFNNNLATQYGAAICSLDYSHFIFTGSTRAIFYSNDVQIKSYPSFGGIIYSHNNCVISFEDKATTVFRHNTAGRGGAVYISHSCYISFEGNSIAEFSYNAADYGGAILLYDNSYISFKGNSATEFSNNTAKQGGAICSQDNGRISFKGNSTTEFSNNAAIDYGGSIKLQNKCHIYFEGDSTIKFSNNTADLGGAIFSYDNSYISFEEKSTIEFGIMLLSMVELYFQMIIAIYFLKEIPLQSLVTILLIMVAQYGLRKTVIYLLKRILLQSLVIVLLIMVELYFHMIIATYH